MQTIQTGAFNALTFNDQLTLKEIHQHTGNKAHELHILAISHGLDITGPVYWIYKGADGNPDTQFDLTIAVPVSGDLSSINPECRSEIKPFKAVWQIHKGNWHQMGETYMRIMSDIQQVGFTPTGECREQYLLVDFSHPENNITFVCVGIE